MPYELDPGGGTFYAPKIDVYIEDALGREWQMATIQADYQLPQRFDLEYRATDGGFERPVVIHYAIYGSFERFIGIITEHYTGSFPLWLAPVQVMLKLRDAQEQKIPVMVVVGDRDLEAGAVSPRLRTGDSSQGVSLDDFISDLQARSASRELWPMAAEPSTESDS